MFTVGFDVSALDPNFREHAWRGIGRYVRHLKDGMLASNPSDLVIKDFEHDSFIPRALIDSLPFGRVTVEQQLLFPVKLWWQGRKHFDLLHFPAHMDAPSWCKLPYVITVLDLIPVVMADLYKADRPGWRFKLARSLEMKGIQNASLILTISENTARDVHTLLGVPREKIRVTPLGVDQKFFADTEQIDEIQVRQSLAIPNDRPVVLYVGGIDQRKNYPMLVKSITALVRHYKSLGKPAPVLVMAGAIERDLQYPKLLKLIEQEDASADIVLSGYVSDSQLLQLYAISSVFLYLSLYEGFGLPVLEAMARGIPVVAGNNSAMPEVVQDAGLLVDVNNLDEVVTAVKNVLDSKQLASSLAAAGQKQACSFTWQKTTDLTLSAYREFSTSRPLRAASNA